ncbi:MAG: type I 3-dehydroquinate dehydratase, partial [Lachnospiraceae bacterium]|nr:type I 3-dehydroquinate dehydratase [Lachnospiraceae bacterium]
ESVVNRKKGVLSMQKPFDVKGIRFGEGRPVICVPVVESEKDAAIRKIRALTEKKVQMIEWRADCFARMDQPEQVRAVLEEIRPLVRDTVMLFTIRTKQQGGHAVTDEKDILYLNQIAAKSGSIDLVDLEFFEATRPEREIRKLQRMGVRVIASHHDFQATPDERILHMLMDQMKQGGADIAKLAVMPRTADDVLRMLKLTNDTRQRYPGLPVVTMSMGGLGAISRVAGEIFGSCITFGADGETSAPGQMQMDTLAGILDALHDSFTGRSS